MTLRITFAAASAVALFAVACAGAPKPETAADPSRQVKVLDALDADLLPISLAAGADVKANAGREEIAFQGVFVNNRELRAISDTVARAHGFVRVEGSDRRKPFVVCRMGTPCPELPAAGPTRIPVSFTSFRVARDTAYVGGKQLTLTGGRPYTEAICIVLTMQQTRWAAVRRGQIGRAEDCGR